MPLYFAYGSNLDVEQVKNRCDLDPKFVSVGYLPGHRLAFTQYYEPWGGGVADVVKDPHSEVWGVVYELSSEAIKRLDSYEGYYGESNEEGLNEYDRTLHTIITPEGHRYTAWVYSVIKRDGDFIPPSKRYLDVIKRAAQAFGFPPSYLSYLESIETAPTKPS